MGRSKMKSKPSMVVPSTRRTTAILPAGYAALLEDLKAQIGSAQVKAAVSVNRELIELYWQIGEAIVERQRAEGWGNAVIDRLAEDLQAAFPAISGFSRTNIYRMRAFFLAYSQGTGIVPQPVGQTPKPKVPQAVGQISATLPQPVREIPWGHNAILIEKVKDPAERLWYAQQTIAHGWSRAMLVHQIESDLHARAGKAITNFKTTLPAPQSDLAHQLIKDPYNFDFLTLSTDAQKRELEAGLLGATWQFERRASV